MGFEAQGLEERGAERVAFGLKGPKNVSRSTVLVCLHVERGLDRLGTLG